MICWLMLSEIQLLLMNVLNIPAQTAAFLAYYFRKVLSLIVCF